MTSIDRRAVQMDFNNQQFENGVKTSVKSLDTLKRGLNLDESSRSLINLGNAGKGLLSSFSLSGIADGVQNISSKFSALGVIGFTVIQNIINSLLDLGKKAFDAALNIQSIKGGFAEYEASLSAFQTIMANTASAGTTIDEVNAALAELNVYANKTVYSYGDMTKAAGLFTAQGVNLKDSLAGIKGIFNIIALTGGDANKANSAIYQLSQAIASGTVKAQDWISVVNAGIGGTDFQNQLKQTARVHGVAVDDMIKKEGSFKASLQTGWLTSAILLETLTQYTGDLSDAQLKSMGYTADQIKQIQALGARATESATKLKSFSQMMEMLSSNLVTSWASSFKIVIGDLGEASDLWTYIGNTVGGILQGSADARNNLLQGWKGFGGRASLVAALKNTFEGLLSILKPIKDAFSTIFPPMTAYRLASLTWGLKTLTERLKISDDTAKKIRYTFYGIASVLDLFIFGITKLVGWLFRISGAVAPSTSSILDFTASIGNWLLELRNAIKYRDAFPKLFEKIRTSLEPVIAAFKTFIAAIMPTFNKIKNFLSDTFSNIDVNTSGVTTGISSFVEKLHIRFAPLAKIFQVVGSVIGWFAEVIQRLAPIFYKLTGIIGKAIGAIGKDILDSLGNLNYNGMFDALNGGLIAALLLAIKSFVTKGSGVFDGVTGILNGVQSSLMAWQSNIKAKTLMTIAIAIAILAASLVVLSLIDSAKLTTSITAITIMFGELLTSMSVFNKIDGGKGAISASAQMMAIAASVLLLAIAVTALSKLNAVELTNGLIGVGVVLTELAVFLKVTNLDGVGATKGAGLLLLATSLIVLSEAVKKFGAINPEALKQGLLAIGIVLGELAIFVTATSDSKKVISTAIGLTIMAAAMLIFVDVISRLGAMPWDQLEKGLVAMAAALISITIAVNLMPKDMILTGIALVTVATSLIILSEALKTMGKMTWEEIGKGLATLAGSLTILAIAMYAMTGGLPGAAAMLVIAPALMLLSQALIVMGKMSWEEIGRGLGALAGSLAILAIAMYAMTGSLPGAAALLIISAAIAIFAPSLKLLGSMKLDEIGRALLALSGVFLIIGIAGLALGPLVPVLYALSGATMLFGLACVAIGVGALAFSAGLTALAASGAAGAAALTLIIKTIISLIPQVTASLGMALISFIELIGKAGPVILQTLTVILLSLIQAIIAIIPDLIKAIVLLVKSVLQGITELLPTIITFITNFVGTVIPVVLKLFSDIVMMIVNTIVDLVPKVVNAILGLVTALLQVLADNLPKMLQAGIDIILNILKGIRDNIAEIVTVAIEIVTNFIDAVAKKLPDVIESGIGLILSFINGLADGIEKHSLELDAAIAKLVKAVIDGIVNGILAGIGAVQGAVRELVRKALAALGISLDANSPSKETQKYGTYFVQGFVKGVNQYSSTLDLTIKKFGETTTSNLSDAFSQILDFFNQNLDMNPTIRPVIDLTDVINGKNQISSFFGPQSLNLSATANRLPSMTNGIPGSRFTGTQINEPSNQTISFTQNNYSPKALSRIDLYRQTKNQLLSIKGLVGKI